MSNPKWIIYAGLAAGVAAIAGGMVFATDAQQQNIPDTAVPQLQAQEGSVISDTGLGPELNKERWHEDPFADEAAKIKANAGV